MDTLDPISEAIEEFESKKKRLQEAYEQLQQHSHLLSSSSFPSWPDIDSHFSTIHSSLVSRFSSLQDKEQQFPESFQHTANPPVLREPPNPETPGDELRGFCEKMQSVNLRNWLKKFWMCEFRVPLNQALKFAEDPAKLVLDTIGVSPLGGEKFIGISTCSILLEELMSLEGLSVSAEVKGRAKSLAVEWKGKLKKEGTMASELMLFLQLLSSFGLREEFDKDELTEYLQLVVLHRQAFEHIKLAATLCKVLGLEDKVPDLVQDISRVRGKLQAIRFVCELKLTEKFPVVPLLKSYLNNAHEQAERIRRTQNNERLAASRELGALRRVLQLIKTFNLESKYPLEVIDKRLKNLEVLQENEKHAADTQMSMPKDPKQLKNKNPKPKPK